MKDLVSIYKPMRFYLEIYILQMHIAEYNVIKQTCNYIGIHSLISLKLKRQATPLQSILEKYFNSSFQVSSLA